MSNVNLSIGAPGNPEVSAEAAAEFDSYVDDTTDVQLEDAPHVNELQVRLVLKTIGNVTSYGIGRKDVEDHWKFSDQELDDLSPPMMRIINRRPELRAAVARGDEASIAIVLSGYVGRNMITGQQAKNAERKRQRDELEGQAENTGGDNGASSNAAPQGQATYGGPLSGFGGAEG